MSTTQTSEIFNKILLRLRLELEYIRTAYLLLLTVVVASESAQVRTRFATKTWVDML
jgi:hypothetical protein